MMKQAVYFFFCYTFSISISYGQTYRAAVVQHEPTFSLNFSPIELLLANANIYAKYAEAAAEKGADIIVFPEYGLITLEINPSIPYARNAVMAYFQDVPDPNKVSWNPCLQPNSFTNTQVLHVLSCIAYNNSITVLANLLSHEPCTVLNDSNCPDDGKYLYNTNVVFDRNGTFISRYHKKYLFREILLNYPEEAEYAIFKIESTELASIVCFDLLYEDPAVKLVTEKGIKNIILSTAWGNEMPLLMGPQAFAAWAQGLGVNLLVTNYYKPENSDLGSGIYSSQQGAVAETFDISSKGQYIIADLPVNPQPVPELNNECPDCFVSGIISPALTSNSSNVPFVMINRPSSVPVQPIHRVYYQSLKNFSAVYLDLPKGVVNVNHGDAFCSLDYSFVSSDDPAIYALLAYDGIRPFNIYRLGLQVCAVMRCEVKGDIERCGRAPNFKASTVFRKFSLVAKLNSEIVFPSMTDTDLQLIGSDSWSFSTKYCSANKSYSKIIINKNIPDLNIVAMYSRLYDRDYTEPNQDIYFGIDEI